MANLFPLVCNFEGDYGMKLLMVDEESTMDMIANQAASALVGVLVKKPKPGSIYRISRHCEDEKLPRDLKVKDAGFIKMEAIDIVAVPAATLS